MSFLHYRTGAALWAAMSFMLLFLSLFPRLNPLTTATLPEGSFIVVMRGILAVALVVLVIFVENFWERVVLLLLAVDRLCALPLGGTYAQVSKASPFLMGASGLIAMIFLIRSSRCR